MNAYHICSACRREINRIRPDKLLQWHSRASFISLVPGPQNTEKRWKDGSHRSAEQNSGHNSSSGSSYTKPRRRAPAKENPDTADVLESLFEDSLHAPRNPDRSPSKPTPSALEPYQHFTTLRRMMKDKNRGLLDSWEFFVKHFGPDAWQKGLIDRKSCPTYLKSTARELLGAIISAKDRDPFSEELPTIVEVTRIYSELTCLRGDDWTAMVLSLTDSYLRKDGLTNPLPRLRDLFLTDLLGSWNIVCRRPEIESSSAGKMNDSSLDWSHVPTYTPKKLLQICRGRGGILPGFGLLLPGYSISELRDVPLVAIATFSLLAGFGDDIVKDVRPLMSTLSHIITACNLENHQLNELFGSSSPIVANYVKENWPVTKKWASESVGEVEKFTASRPVGSRPDFGFIYKRVDYALGKRDAPEVDSLWAEVANYPIITEANPETIPTLASQRKYGSLTEGLCNYFISVYIALNKPDRAIDVWNHMVHSGITPNLATWDAMLNGCRVARNPHGVEDIWVKMKAAGVQPDVFCWTTRITVLMDCGRVEAAIHALHEMGKIWLQEAKKTHCKMSIEQLQKMDGIKGAVKPTIETVNAAVVGLLKKQQPEAAYHVLGWAGKFGIDPDLITYNTLLKPLIRDGNTKQAMRLLTQMQQQNIEPDVATFTTILEASFRNSHQLSFEEQLQIISSVFSEMEEAGVKPNLYTYGRIIYQLLESGRGDLSVVNVVIETMAKQGLRPSAHIYTMLVDHYFDQEPANLDAVRSLIHRVTLEVGVVDHVFWSRVVEGYARAGDSMSAMRIFERVGKGQSRVGWVTMRILLAALAQNDQWDAAKTVVREAYALGMPINRERGTEGQHNFWEFASKLNLVEA
ncbi:hypothetical protein B7494_g5995 [Chlorociboria aeruginascens]|nr:hypothetical protein B7494_g5995 [Chlorociboria aeruginascens]